MIVRAAVNGLWLITQPDHARLARTIMERCVPLNGLSRRESILHAIGEHDAAWAEVDAAPTVSPDDGSVVDFVHLPVPERQAVWPRAVARLAADPWAAALVAHHAITVYDRFRPDREWTSFFSGLEVARDANVRACGLSLAELESDYAYLRLGDLISLAFCTGWTDEQRFRNWSVRLSGRSVVVVPDPFSGAEIPIEVAAREIRRGPFGSDTELRAALTGAVPRTLRGEVAGKPG